MRGRAVRFAAALGVGVLYFGAGKLGLAFAIVHANATAVWPPTGIALAAVLLLGRGIWPVIFAGAFFVNVSTAGTVLSSLGIAAGNTLEALVGAALVERFARGAAAFDRAQDIFKFVVTAALFSTSRAGRTPARSGSRGGSATPPATSSSRRSCCSPLAASPPAPSARAIGRWRRCCSAASARSSPPACFTISSSTRRTIR